jgi:hypothetical protein
MQLHVGSPLCLTIYGSEIVSRFPQKEGTSVKDRQQENWT